MSRFFHFLRKIDYCLLFPCEINYYGFFKVLTFSIIVNIDLIKKCTIATDNVALKISRHSIELMNIGLGSLHSS